jgi:SAM-dependent methyltransferase
MSHDTAKKLNGSAKSREWRYDNLLRIASWTIPYVPIFESWEKYCNEYRRGEVEIEVVPSTFRLPEVFQRNALPTRIQNNLNQELIRLEDFGKCRFVRYRPDLLGAGTSRLTFQISPISYLDYLRSGEYLDSLVHPSLHNDGRTFREEFASRITTSQDFDSLPLTNICGVGVFLLTADNKIIISRHSESVDVCRGNLSYSASGTMDWNRVGEPFTGSPSQSGEWLEFLHPFSQVCRECEEETGHRTSQNLTLVGLGIDAKRLYFQFSFFEQTSRSSVDILNEAPRAKHYHTEFAGKEDVDLGLPLNAVDFELDRIVSLVRSSDWEPAAAAALLSLCVREFGIDRVERAIDLECVRERWKKEMISEWRQRASRYGEAAVMSSRYPATRSIVESQKFLDEVLAFVGSDCDHMDVVEIGAGTGRMTKHLVKSARRLTCIDLSTEMIARNRNALGAHAEKVSYLLRFSQDYQPEQRHDVVISSLVLVHNVDDDAWGRLVNTMCACADSIFLFEHVDDPRMPHPHTRLRRAEDLVAAFSNYEVIRRRKYFLFEDQILFLKLRRRDLISPYLTRGSDETLPSPKRINAPTKSYRYDAFISYRHQDPDRKVVRQLLTDLETAGYKVAIDERDFEASGAVLQEMERCIKQSRFTLIIASPRYFQSGNTLEEAIMCKVLDMEELNRRIITVTIEKSEMPAWLFNIVGIDFTTQDPLIPPLDRLIAALRTPLP